MWFFGKRCKHNWVILVDKFIESNVERLVKDKKDALEHSKIHFRYLATDLCATSIIILKFTNCNKLDKTITKT